jgi:hypothetical protein
VSEVREDFAWAARLWKTRAAEERIRAEDAEKALAKYEHTLGLQNAALLAAEKRAEEAEGALRDWEETVHYALSFIEWLRNSEAPEAKTILDGYADRDTGYTYDEWATAAENGLNRIKLEIHDRLAPVRSQAGG